MSEPASSRASAQGDGYHHGDLRRALLQAAGEILIEGGPTALSLRGIARRVGVAAPSVYHHFPGLDAIALALAEDGFAELLRRLEGEPLNPQGRLSNLGLAYIGFALDHPALYRLMFGEGLKVASPESGSLRALRGRAYERLKDGLHRRLPEAEVAPAALFLWSLVHGLALLMIDGQVEAVAGREATIRRVLRLAGTGIPLAGDGG